MGDDSSRTSRRAAYRGATSPVPVDLLAVVAATALADAAVLSLPAGSPLRVAAGLPLLFFLPGYGVLAVLFPAYHDGDPTDGPRDWSDLPGRETLAPFERLALSVGVSVALVPLVGLGVAVSPAEPTPAVLSTLATAVVVLGVGYRWWAADAANYPSPGAAFAAVAAGSAREQAVNVAVLAVAAAAVVVLVGAVAAPPAAESYTDVSLLTENESGEYVTGGYPSRMTSGESAELVLGVDNQEGERTDYAVVVVLQRVDGDGDDATVVASERVGRFEFDVADGATAYVTHEVTPTMTGRNLRLTYLVYRGDAPADPAVGTAYRRVHVWVDVVGQGSERT